MNPITVSTGPGGVPASYSMYVGPVDRPALGEPGYVPSAADLDHDGLDYTHDNCVYIYNPDQKDNAENGGRGNGIGDATRSCTDSAGVVHTIDCTTSVNPDTDNDGVMDVCDNCPTANATQDNCNFDVERIFYAPPLYTYHGDACDQFPCPTSSFEGLGTTSPGPLIGNATGTGHAYWTDSSGSPGLTGTGTTGFRYCWCDGVHGNDWDTRALCDASGVYQCNRDDVAGFVKWHDMGLFPGATPARKDLLYHAPPFGGTEDDQPDDYSGTWDFTHDPSLPPGSLHVLGPDSRFQGVYWSRVETTLTGCTGAACPPHSYFNSHYWSGDVHLATVILPVPALTFIGPLLPSRAFCPACADAYPHAFLPQVYCATGPCPSPQVFARFAGVDDNVTTRVSSTAISHLRDTGVAWVAPSEPAQTLRESAVRLVEVSSNAPSTVLGSLVDADGTLRFLSPQGGPPQSPSGGGAESLSFQSGAFPVLLGNPGTMYVVGANLLSYDRITIQPSVVKTTVGLAGTAPATVLGAAPSPAGGGLVVVDHSGSSARILWVDFSTQTSSVLAAYTWHASHDLYSLAAVGDGTYVLLASSASTGKYSLVRFSANLVSGVTATRALLDKTPFAVGTIVADHRGISVPVTGTNWQPTGFLYSSFGTASGSTLSTMF